MNKVGLPKGMRDFSPKVMAKRNYIFDIIKAAFRLHGFEQIETPAMENLETLTGKYGDEGDRLIFKILQRGDKLVNEVNDIKKQVDKTYNHETNDESQWKTSIITGLILHKLVDGALKYDLTVPFARYVVQHQNEISFPFKRFQIQPVWRADRPQKGRYREFYQCDADIIGSDSMWNEVDLIQLFDEVLSNLGLNDFSIKINHRKILSGIAELIGKPEMLIPITVAIDKLDKIGLEKVMEELESKGLTQNELSLIQPLFDLGGENTQVLSDLKKLLASSTIALEGIKEV
jgi:histidyl-tRNA synthetase